MWLSSLAEIDEILASSRIQDVVLLGFDVNQNLHCQEFICFCAFEDWNSMLHVEIPGKLEVNELY